MIILSFLIIFTFKKKVLVFFNISENLGRKKKSKGLCWENYKANHLNASLCRDLYLKRSRTSTMEIFAL